MAFRIIGGNGRGYEACVTEEGNLCSFSIVESDFNHHSEDGQAFLLSSTEIELNNTAESAILYLKNDSNFDLHFNFLQLSWQSSVGGTNGFKMSAYLNPTGGTLISNAVQGGSFPLNHGSPNQFTGLVYQGVQDDTQVGGTLFGSVCLDATKADYREIDITGNILSKGQSFAFSITPPAGNTQFFVTLSLRCFFKSRNVGTS